MLKGDWHKNNIYGNALSTTSKSSQSSTCINFLQMRVGYFPLSTDKVTKAYINSLFIMFSFVISGTKPVLRFAINILDLFLTAD